ncbi:unnamed protein product [Cuscuta epithymum]|uniref:Protein kinase domain-containing protein n=1 Tax=Cuscuta epithymum TaxID=186058 RepID=A0AAV0DF62_9ASTE|nr:unnamed protein product [Cuscuta epithymum]
MEEEVEVEVEAKVKTEAILKFAAYHKREEIQPETMEKARGEDGYVLDQQPIRTTSSGVMMKAAAVFKSPSSSDVLKVPVQILAVKTHKMECLYELLEAYKLAKRCPHKNLVGLHVSFKNPRDDRLWIVMSDVSRVSLRRMMTSLPSPLPEPMRASILRQTLEALDCIHTAGDRAHGDVCAGLVYLDGKDFSKVKLGFRELMCEGVTKPPAECWVAPEFANDPKMAHGKAADVWMYGLFILEVLSGGRVPVSTYKEVRDLVKGKNISVDFSSKKSNPSSSIVKKVFGCGFNNCKKMVKKKEILECSDSLADLIRQCLHEDPKRRPSCRQLLEHPYFKPSSNVERDYAIKVNKVLALHLKKSCGQMLS